MDQVTFFFIPLFRCKEKLMSDVKFAETLKCMINFLLISLMMDFVVVSLLKISFV